MPVGIVEEDLGRVRSETDLVALVSERVALRRVGTRWVGLCPFHAEKTPSFSINAELGFYYCFGCQARGDAITFVRETEHLDFVGAVELLAGRGGHLAALRRRTGRPQVSASRPRLCTRRSSGPSLGTTSACWRRPTPARQEVPARARLRRRHGAALPPGLGAGRLGHVRAGARGPRSGSWSAPGWLSATSGGSSRTSFRARVLFPIFDAAGRPVGFGGRVLPGGDGPKYKNTPATPLYDKSGSSTGSTGPRRRSSSGARWSCARATPTSSACTAPGCSRRWRLAAPRWPKATSGCSAASPAASCSPTTPTQPARARPSTSTTGNAGSGRT